MVYVWGTTPEYGAATHTETAVAANPSTRGAYLLNIAIARYCNNARQCRSIDAWMWSCPFSPSFLSDFQFLLIIFGSVLSTWCNPRGLAIREEQFGLSSLLHNHSSSVRQLFVHSWARNLKPWIPKPDAVQHSKCPFLSHMGSNKSSQVFEFLCTILSILKLSIRNDDSHGIKGHADQMLGYVLFNMSSAQSFESALLLNPWKTQLSHTADPQLLQCDSKAKAIKGYTWLDSELPKHARSVFCPKCMLRSTAAFLQKTRFFSLVNIFSTVSGSKLAFVVQRSG